MVLQLPWDLWLQWLSNGNDVYKKVCILHIQVVMTPLDVHSALKSSCVKQGTTGDTKISVLLAWGLAAIKSNRSCFQSHAPFVVISEI